MYFVCTREEEDCKELYGGAWGYYWNKEDAFDAVCADFARMYAYDDLGGWGVVTIWEVTEV